MPSRAHFSPLYFLGISAAEGGRSRMWPIEDSTTQSDPRNLEMVLALAGDSTMIRGFAFRHAAHRRTESSAVVKRELID